VRMPGSIGATLLSAPIAMFGFASLGALDVYARALSSPNADEAA